MIKFNLSQNSCLLIWINHKFQQLNRNQVGIYLQGIRVKCITKLLKMKQRLKEKRLIKWIRLKMKNKKNNKKLLKKKVFSKDCILLTILLGLCIWLYFLLVVKAVYSQPLVAWLLRPSLLLWGLDLNCEKNLISGV